MHFLNRIQQAFKIIFNNWNCLRIKSCRNYHSFFRSNVFLLSRMQDYRWNWRNFWKLQNTWEHILKYDEIIYYMIDILWYRFQAIFYFPSESLDFHEFRYCLAYCSASPFLPLFLTDQDIFNILILLKL